MKRLDRSDVPMNEKRILDVKEACAYLSIGRNSVRKYCKSIGAVKRIGSRVLYDRLVIDKAVTDDKGQ